ncbi:preprotein translocase, SecG subunit, putative [Verrucomicrobiia bacterium DG1235]|nr:preprotein translocase, SecG subunit, putative [Verrucomicrobiae bacterium DG1235]
MEFLNALLTVVLVLVSVFMILLVLMQRGSANGGLGAAMGGGMAESALGAETTSVLSKWTRNTAIVFFVLTFGLYLSKLNQHELAMKEEASALPEIEATEPSAASSMLQELISQSEDLEAAATDAAVEAEAAVEGAAEELPVPAEQ